MIKKCWRIWANRSDLFNTALFAVGLDRRLSTVTHKIHDTTKSTMILYFPCLCSDSASHQINHQRVKYFWVSNISCIVSYSQQKCVECQNFLQIWHLTALKCLNYSLTGLQHKYKSELVNLKPKTNTDWHIPPDSHTHCTDRNILGNESWCHQ